MNSICDPITNVRSSIFFSYFFFSLRCIYIILYFESRRSKVINKPIKRTNIIVAKNIIILYFCDYCTKSELSGSFVLREFKFLEQFYYYYYYNHYLKIYRYIQLIKLTCRSFVADDSKRK